MNSKVTYTPKRRGSKSSFELEWRVDIGTCHNFNLSCLEFVAIDTDYFATSWSLKLFHKTENPDYIAIFLCLESGPLNYMVHYKFTRRIDPDIKDGNKVEPESRTDSWDASVVQRRGLPNWIKTSEFLDRCYWLCDDATGDFYLGFHVQIELKPKNHQIITSIKHPSLAQDLLNVLKTGFRSDVTFLIGSTEFPVHRVILAARCSYFSSMFDSSFKEANETQITITDVEADIFNLVLEYIYANKIPEDMKMYGFDLLLAADKYGLETLTRECEKYLGENVTLDNFTALLKFADSRNRSDLIQYVHRFIKSNWSLALISEVWEELKRENLKLAN